MDRIVGLLGLVTAFGLLLSVLSARAAMRATPAHGVDPNGYGTEVGVRPISQAIAKQRRAWHLAVLGFSIQCAGAVGLAALALAREPEPRSVDECLLRKVKPGLSQDAVNVLTAACQSHFASAPQPGARDLTPSELALITGRASPLYGGSGVSHFAGTLYNGNVSLLVVEAEISLTTTVGGRNETTRYRTGRINLGALQAGDFTISIIGGDSGARYAWQLSSARGIPTSR